MGCDTQRVLPHGKIGGWVEKLQREVGAPLPPPLTPIPQALGNPHCSPASYLLLSRAEARGPNRGMGHPSPATPVLWQRLQGQAGAQGLEAGHGS